MASFDFRNPFLDDGDAHQMSTSQLDLTQPLDSAAFQPPMANASIRNVARGSPIIVHPPGDHADLLCHVAEHGTLDPFTDESEPFYVGMDDGSDNFVTEVSTQRTVARKLIFTNAECAERDAQQAKTAKHKLNRCLPKICGLPPRQDFGYRVHPTTRRRTS